eukprot:scaffold10663_cov29-Prasinocladus_malaysianus.AAC.1
MAPKPAEIQLQWLLCMPIYWKSVGVISDGCDCHSCEPVDMSARHHSAKPVCSRQPAKVRLTTHKSFLFAPDDALNEVWTAACLLRDRILAGLRWPGPIQCPHREPSQAHDRKAGLGTLAGRRAACAAASLSSSSSSSASRESNRSEIPFGHSPSARAIGKAYVAHACNCDKARCKEKTATQPRDGSGRQGVLAGGTRPCRGCNSPGGDGAARLGLP